VQVFSHHGIPLAGGDTADLQFGNWTSTGQGIFLVTTHDGQQTSQTLRVVGGGARGPAGAFLATDDDATPGRLVRKSRLTSRRWPCCFVPFDSGFLARFVFSARL